MNAAFASALALAALTTGLIEASSIFHQEPVMAAEITVESAIEYLKSANTDAFYNEAREVLGEDYYTLYRIVERLARSNGLDDYPWRVRLNTEYEINAFASELNTLTFMAAGPFHSQGSLKMLEFQASSNGSSDYASPPCPHPCRY